MRELKIMARKEVKALKALIKGQWGADFEPDCVFLKSREDDIFLASRELFDVGLSELRMDSFGLYLGQLKRGELRLGIEGSQVIGPLAAKNVVELSFSEMREFFHGVEIEMEKSGEGYVILRHGNDFIGCSRFKEGKLLNFTPKVRRVKAAD